MVKVSVVILNFKVKRDSLECIESVQKSDYKNVKLIVVDNNSEDGLSGAINDKSIEFIQNDQNLGFTGGNNIGVKKALEQGADYIFILNPDAVVEEDTISNLVREAQNYSIDIVGPKVLFADRKTIWYAGGIFDKKNVLGSHKGVNEKDQGQYEKSEVTDYVTGAALFVRSEVFKKIGLFDDRFFLYYEDADFCIRAKRVGFSIMYIPSAKVYHKNAKSTGLGSSLQDYFITRNRMLIAYKFLPFRTRFALLRESLRNLGSPVRRLAFFDFLMGKFGKGSFL